jgi:hypothetical protein
MSHQQLVRAQCMDCAMPMFVPSNAGVEYSRCERCLRRYGQQLYLLLEFLKRS